MIIGGEKNGRPLLFSVTREDFDRQTFRAGGNGGQHQNKTETGVRLIHRLSGARGEARDSRSQAENERAALERLLETKEWKSWHRATAFALLSGKTIEEAVDEWMKPSNLRVEVRVNGKWVDDPDWETKDLPSNDDYNAPVV